MRISDCADLTGTTVRTIRYYHQIGLLPVPDRVAGRREYALDHIARILRIRWLADAGLPLDSIAALIEGDDPGDAKTASLHDLYATAASIDERIAELTDQRRRIGTLIEMAEQGKELRALSPAWNRFYDQLAASVTDPETLKVLRKEQRLAEMFAQRGLVPADGEALLTRLNDEDLQFVVSFYTRYAHLGRLPAAEADRVMTELVDGMAAWCRDHADLTADMLAILPDWARSPRALNTLINFACLVSSNHRQSTVLRSLVPIVCKTADVHDATSSSEGPREGAQR